MYTLLIMNCHLRQFAAAAAAEKGARKYNCIVLVVSMMKKTTSVGHTYKLLIKRRSWTEFSPHGQD